MKIGVITPTYNRPDFARLLVLQMLNQNLRPDIVCIHQNGTPYSYQWAISDIATGFKIEWIHTPDKIEQDEWYARPLEALIDLGCTHFFWADHDDIYQSNHISNGINLLSQGYDHIVNANSGILLLKKPVYEYEHNRPFDSHDPGGMSSSMCFGRKFAEHLLIDLRSNKGALRFSDQVVRRVTMPKFNCYVNNGDQTTIYVCHSNTVSSSHWL